MLISSPSLALAHITCTEMYLQLYLVNLSHLNSAYGTIYHTLYNTEEIHFCACFYCRHSHGKKTDKPKTEVDEQQVTSDMSRMSMSNDKSGNALPVASSSASDIFSSTMSWSKLSSSDSEFSESEGGQSSKLRMLHCRIRQCALSCFYAIVKVCWFMHLDSDYFWGGISI